MMVAISLEMLHACLVHLLLVVIRTEPFGVTWKHGEESNIQEQK